MPLDRRSTIRAFDIETKGQLELFTLGYSGIPQEMYFNIMQLHDVEVLVDVRRLPLSRKPGYSKKRLAEAAEARGLTYLHLVALGTPNEIRLGMKHGSTEFDRAVGEYLNTQTEPMNALADLVRKQNCCLLCVESDIRECHRRIVADQIAHLIGRDKLAVTHLSK